MCHAIHRIYAAPTQDSIPTYWFSTVPSRYVTSTAAMDTVKKPANSPRHWRRAGPFPYRRAAASEHRFAGPGVMAQT